MTMQINNELSSLVSLHNLLAPSGIKVVPSGFDENSAGSLNLPNFALSSSPKGSSQPCSLSLTPI